MNGIDIIEGKIDIILSNLDYLDDVKTIPKKDFISSFEKVQASKHSLQEAIEASLDIANHLISSNGWKRAETYADMFLRLFEHQVIDKDLMEKLSAMARFRNILVHRYGSFDDERLWLILQEDIRDIAVFVQEIERVLNHI